MKFAENNLQPVWGLYDVYGLILCLFFISFLRFGRKAEEGATLALG